MYACDSARQEVIRLLKCAGIDCKRIERPPKNIDADFSFPCFRLAKERKIAPNQIASDIKNKIDESGKHELIERCQTMGPYVNFYADKDNIAKETIQEVERLSDEYGIQDEGKNKRIIIEYISANPIHPLHIGSARNALLGKSLVNTYKNLKYDVRSHYYMNDIGLQVAKVAFGYSRLQDKTPTERPDVWIGKIYAITSAIMSGDKEVEKELAEKWPRMHEKVSCALKDENDIDSKVKDLLEKIEKGDKKTSSLFKEVGKICTEGFRKTLERVNISFDSIDYESSFIRDGSVYRIIDELKEKGVLKLSDQDTWIIDLEKYKLPTTVLVRSNGTTLYLTRDVAYSIYKFEKKKADQVINIIASEQELPQQQLSAILDIMGKEYANYLHHLSYGMVNLPGIKMSGRRGRYITFDDVFDQAISKAYEVVDEKNPDLPGKQKKDISEMVGKGAVIYSILKVEARKDVTFDLDEALDFNGNSAPYIQYTYARAKSILRKAGKQDKPNIKDISDNEYRIIKMVADFPETIRNAASNRSPHIIANYLFELAQGFNNFYNTTPVIKSGKDVKSARLAIVKAVAQTIKNGLSLLEIKAPEKM